MKEDSPKLFLVCGYVASGKTTVSNKLAKYFSTDIIRTDDLRKELFTEELDYNSINLKDEHVSEKIENWIAGQDSDLVDFQQVLNPLRKYENFGEIIDKYDSMIGIQGKKTYETAFLRCENALCGGKSVVFDATFSDKSKRNRIYNTAKTAGLEDIYIVEVLCDEKTVLSRLEKRKGQNKNTLTSNAHEVEIYKKIKEAFDNSNIDSDAPEGLDIKRYVYHTDTQKIEFYGKPDGISDEIHTGVIDPLVKRYSPGMGDRK